MISWLPERQPLIARSKILCGAMCRPSLWAAIQPLVTTRLFSKTMLRLGLTVRKQNFIIDFQQGLELIKFIGVTGVSSYNDLVLADDGSGHTLIIAGGDQVDLPNVTF